MKVPKYIRQKMHIAARHAALMAKEMRDVDAWFEAQGFDVDLLRRGNGYSLEEIEYGNDVTEVFCNDIENGAYPKERS